MISLLKKIQAEIVLIRPGATMLDAEGRMKGSLDMPLCETGERQADELVDALQNVGMDAVYCGPCESAIQTATRLAVSRKLKPRVIDAFENIDHGLWHGKLIDELRRTQPRLYREGVDNPEGVCPPGGESIHDAKTRVEKVLRRLVRKSNHQVIGLVVPEPLASVIASVLHGERVSSIWQHETDSAHWQLISVEQ